MILLYYTLYYIIINTSCTLRIHLNILQVYYDIQNVNRLDYL